MFNRRVDKTKGFFVELRKQDIVHPNHYSVHCVDGNGTKLFLAAWKGDYSKAPIDGIAMNANDMATVINAFPDCLNLYIASQTGVEKKHMGEIMSGFANALNQIRYGDEHVNVNIGKIETASLDEMISLGVLNKGVDFGIVLTGFIEKDKVPNLNPQSGHYIVGVSSSGLHSNGFTGARHTLLKPSVEPRGVWKGQYKGEFELDSKPEILEGLTIMEALEVPTAIYLKEANMIGQKFNNKDIYGVNITGNGLYNFNRVGKNVTFSITDPFEPHPIQKLLMEKSGWTEKISYTKQNNGMGFAYIVPNKKIAEEIVAFINEIGNNRAKIVGKILSNTRVATVLNDYNKDKTPLVFTGYNN